MTDTDDTRIEIRLSLETKRAIIRAAGRQADQDGERASTSKWVREQIAIGLERETTQELELQRLREEG